MRQDNHTRGVKPAKSRCKVYKPSGFDASGATCSQGWQADLSLAFQSDERARTLLSHCRHRGPLQVQRPFYPESAGGACHVYILHPPGGVVGGDGLRVTARLEPKARVVLTTPAAGKFYRSAGAEARLEQHFTVAASAALEWLPQENIFYNGARVHATTRIEVPSGACFLGWEILCLGRPAAGERFTRGYCRQDLEVWRDGEPLLLEHARFEGGGELLSAAWGMQGRPVYGSLVCVAPTRGLEPLVRAAVAAHPDEGFAVTQLDGILVCRYLGDSAQRARRLFTQTWTALRPALIGRPACPPRVWNS